MTRRRRSIDRRLSARLLEMVLRRRRPVWPQWWAPVHDPPSHVRVRPR